MRFEPLFDKILVLPDVADDKTKGGIILPDQAKDKPVVGTIISVGPGKIMDDGTRLAMEVKPKDRVFYGRYAGSEIELEGVKYLALRQDDIVGKLV